MRSYPFKNGYFQSPTPRAGTGVGNILLPLESLLEMVCNTGKPGSKTRIVHTKVREIERGREQKCGKTSQTGRSVCFG
jgi:hypothetical protein